jgi:hypothetical protein
MEVAQQDHKVHRDLKALLELLVLQVLWALRVLQAPLEQQVM